MAFNFNWSPLAADASFYARATDLLTAALNKSPKPPIIVDDILVTELNLGSVPPDLEILEIGDLAEDRFRGIFKMCYTGDARITLRTRVQVCNYRAYTRASLVSSPSCFSDLAEILAARFFETVSAGFLEMTGVAYHRLLHESLPRLPCMGHIPEPLS